MPRANIRTDSPTIKVRNVDTPKARTTFSGILTNATKTIIEVGTPIGLLLTLTYANEITVTTSATFKGFAPHARIRNVD